MGYGETWHWEPDFPSIFSYTFCLPEFHSLPCLACVIVCNIGFWSSFFFWRALRAALGRTRRRAGKYLVTRSSLAKRFQMDVKLLSFGLVQFTLRFIYVMLCYFVLSFVIGRLWCCISTFRIWCLRGDTHIQRRSGRGLCEMLFTELPSCPHKQFPRAQH